MWNFVVFLIHCGVVSGAMIISTAGTLFYLRKRPARLDPNEPINMIDGIVLPSPDDPRWYLTDEGNYFCLGSIKISNKEIWFWQNGLSATNKHQNVNKYYNAISRQWQSRIAEDSINNAKMPPKVKKQKRLTKADIQAMIPAVEESVHKSKIDKGYCHEKDCWQRPL